MVWWVYVGGYMYMYMLKKKIKKENSFYVVFMCYPRPLGMDKKNPFGFKVSWFGLFVEKTLLRNRFGFLAQMVEARGCYVLIRII